MNTKLTLSINQQVLEQAKAQLQTEGQSLSSLVENYFKALLRLKQVPNPKSLSVADKPSGTPISDELYGMLKPTHNKPIDYDKVRYEALEEKYL